MCLWQEACTEEILVTLHFLRTLDSGLRIIFYVACYGNAFQALRSEGVAPFNDITAREELLHCHLIPLHSSDVPFPLVVESSTVL